MHINGAMAQPHATQPQQSTTARLTAQQQVCALRVPSDMASHPARATSAQLEHGAMAPHCADILY